MKLKVKIKVLTEGCMPEINPKGDWIDLKSAVDVSLPAPQSGVLKRTTIDGEETSFRNVTMETHYIPLGVAMELPKGFEGYAILRSSGPKKMGLFIPNGKGIMDNSYNGNEDEWNLICSTMRETSISKGDRICQFRIQLSQFATPWQKLKWILCSGIKLVEVDNLNNTNRGGLGSTGLK